MASTLIHMAVANQINKKLKRDAKLLLFGTIAPDLSKLVGEDKTKSHFIGTEDNIPVLNSFRLKYYDNFNDDFVLGYYIHLFVDYLWFKYFIPQIWYSNSIKDLNGKIVNCDNDEFCKLLYQDYTNLNVLLIDYYNLPINLFYEPLPNINPIINEIPISKLKLLIDKSSEIIMKSKNKKDYLFDLEMINKFINFSVEVILNDIKI